MYTNQKTVLAVSVMLLVVGVQPVIAASDPVCDCVGGQGNCTGPWVCVRFDNSTEPPAVLTDFKFSFDQSGTPTVTLIQGDNGLGTTFEWRVWSQVSETDSTPADIGGILGTNAEDYQVRLRQPFGNPGAHHIASINLHPSDAANFSNLLDARIAGDFNSKLFLQRSSSGGGDAVLFIGGKVIADLAIPGLGTVCIGSNVSGDIDIATLRKFDNDRTGLDIGGGLTSDIHIGTMLGGSNLRVHGEVKSAAHIEVDGIDGIGTVISLNQTPGT